MNVYLVLIAFFLVVAIVLRVDFVYYILYVCVAVWVWSRLVIPAVLRRVKVHRRTPERVFWNEIFSVDIEVENVSRLPLAWLELRESVVPELRLGEIPAKVVTLPGRGRATLSYRLIAKRRGYYQVGPLHLATGDLFGLAHPFTAQVQPAYVTVYPRLHPLSRLGIPSRLPFGTITTNQRLFEDPARPVGVRGFRSGDSLRQINWKVTAHQRSLMVKTFQPAMSLDAAVALNLPWEAFPRRDRQAYIEWSIEIAASLATHLSDMRQAVGLLANGEDPLLAAGEEPAFDEGGRLVHLAGTGEGIGPPPPIPPRGGRGHLMKILERLARLEAGDPPPFPPWLSTACQHLGWGTTLFVISPTAEAALTGVLHRLTRSGLNPVLILVTPLAEQRLGELGERCRRLGFTFFHIPSRHQLEAWQA